ncbi:MAG: PilT/PilU family type 4a pilus ATPase [Deltaproteobacteria bacterium]|nr:PilT/PilU family type 4a pilus ATPase [Deltaproteobacteria bacterium]
MTRKIAATLKETRFTTPDAVEQALAEAGEIQRADLQKALEVLLELPTSASESYRLGCAFFVGAVKRFPDRALFAPLARALPKAPHPAVREAILRALPLVNNVGDHGLLVQQLHAEKDEARANALKVLEKLAVGPTFEALCADFRTGGHAAPVKALGDVARAFGVRAVPVVAAAMASSDPRVVAAGFEVATQQIELPGFDRSALWMAAKARVRDANEAIASAAISCAGAIAVDDGAYLEVIAPVLEDASVPTVCAALRGMKRFPTTRVLAALEARLLRGPVRVSVAALQTLQDIATDEVIPPLVAALGHRRLAVRTEAVKVLKQLAASTQIDIARAVLWLLRSRNSEVRRMASEVLSAMRTSAPSLWPRLVGFIRDEDWWVRERLADALVPMAGAQLIPHLVPLLDDDNAGVRRFATATLGRVGDAAGLGALLVRARDDHDWLVREAAVRSIGNIGDARAVPYVVKLMATPGLEVACLEVLTASRRDDGAGEIPGLLARPERDVRMAALRYVAAIDARAMADELVLRLADPDADVARLAGATLRQWEYGGNSDPELEEADRVLAQLLRQVVQGDASDLILISGQPAFMKRHGKIERLTSRELTAENVYDLVAPLLSPEQVELLGHKTDVDFSHENRRVGARFRVNVLQGEHGLGAVFRVVKNEVRPLRELGVPAVVETFAELPSGLVLLGGPPGAGKSTTLAGLINAINQSTARHIVTIEDPIEGLHRPVKSVITQREVGVHTSSYASALRSALRQDPDVILVGELRDLETISFAVAAAETGHLVFGTVHAVAADSCVERLISAFPSERHAQIRTMLSDVLRAVVCQHLLPRTDGGRALACEVMINTEAIANLIRKGQSHQIASTMVLGRELGMQLMDDQLAELVALGRVDIIDANVKARDKSRFPVPDDAPLARSAGTGPPSTVVAQPLVKPAPAAAAPSAPTPATARPVMPGAAAKTAGAPVPAPLPTSTLTPATARPLAAAASSPAAARTPPPAPRASPPAQPPPVRPPPARPTPAAPPAAPSPRAAPPPQASGAGRVERVVIKRPALAPGAARPATPAAAPTATPPPTIMVTPELDLDELRALSADTIDGVNLSQEGFDGDTARLPTLGDADGQPPPPKVPGKGGR